MEELLETITWSQLRIHDKPIGILNIRGFYQTLLDWIDRAHHEGFIDGHSRRIVVVGRTAEELLGALEKYEDPIQGPWLLKEEMWKKRGAGRFSVEEV